MQSIRTLFYCLKQGIRSIFHNGMFSLASIGTIAASLFILGLFYFVTSNVNYVMKATEQNVGVTVLFEEGCSEANIKAIGEAIELRAEVADVVFISAVIPVCRELNPMQRMIPGLVLTNGLLFFMMMASSFVETTTLTNIPVIVCGFCALVVGLTFSMIFAGYRVPKK